MWNDLSSLTYYWIKSEIKKAADCWALIYIILLDIKVESEIKKAAELAYINPELADQEKQKGNER